MTETLSRRCKDWISTYMEYTDNSEPPLLYRKWVAISVIAACLKRKCRLELGFLTFYPNMYVVLVGPAGRCRKGIAMEPGKQLLERLGVVTAPDAVTKEQLIVRLKNCNINEVDAHGNIIYHSSLTVFSKELAVFMKDYSEEFLMMLTDWYDCPNEWSYETKTSNKYIIDGVWVNLLGATTPELLASGVTGMVTGGGLASRMVFVNAYNRDKDIPFPTIGQKEMLLKEDLYSDLDKIHSLSGAFQYSDDFEKLYREWYPYQAQHKPFEDPRFDYYFERRANHVLKLSMILNASRTSDMIITGYDLHRAIEIIEDTEKTMSSAFKHVGENVLIVLINQISEYLVKQKVATNQELQRRFLHDADVDTLDRAMRAIEHTGKVQRSINEKGQLEFRLVE